MVYNTDRFIQYFFKVYLLLNFVFIYYTAFCKSLNTYKVCRVNESTYLVTTYPDWDYEQLQTVTSNGTEIPVNVGEKREKPKLKLSASFINKARENYFKTIYSTFKKSNNTDSVITANIQKSNPMEEIEADSNKNLLVARKLASILLDEIQNDNIKLEKKVV